MTSKLMLITIAVIWSLVVVVPLVGRWKDGQRVSSVGRFSNSLSILGRQCRSTDLNISISLNSTTIRQSYVVRRSPATYQRRKRTLGVLLCATFAAALSTVAIGTIGLLFAATTASATVLFLTLVAYATHHQGVSPYPLRVRPQNALDIRSESLEKLTA
jgi:hypothetical protein